jgi:O-antigen/teichoic acid export membrane protein
MTKDARFARLTNTDTVRSELHRNSVHAALATSASSGADFILRIFSTAILARLIVPEHFGIVMMATAIVAVADQLKELGLSAATVQRSSISHQEVSNLFWINVALGCVIAIALCASSPLLASYYREPRLVAVTCVLSSTFFLGSLAVQHQALLTRQLRLGRTALIRLGANVLSTGIAILLAFRGYGYWALIWREVSRSALLAIGMCFSFPWVPSLPSRSADVRQMLGFGANLTAANILSAITGAVDRFVLGRAWGAAAVGVYRQAYQLIAAPTDQVLSPLYQVAQPALSMLQADPARFRRYYTTLLTLVAATTMPLSLFVAVFSFEITMLLLGSQWAQCAPIIMLLSLATFVRQATGSSALILISRGNSRTHLVIVTIYNIAYIIGLFVGVRWGMIGLALAEVAVTYLMIAPRLYFTLRESPVNLSDWLRACFGPATSSLAMAVVLYFINAIVPPTYAIAPLALGALLAPVLFIGGWLLIPGGAKTIGDLTKNLQSGFLRKPSST